MVSMSRHWPMTALRLRTPMLELRFPSQADLDDLVDVALDGVHDPDVMPFTVAWTDARRSELPFNTLQYHWGLWAAWTPERWRLNMVTVRDGEVVGTQELAADDFAVKRETGSGSWIGRRYQGQGIGTEMRAAILHLSFAGLGARCAISGAYHDNAASLAVSRKLGYSADGIRLENRRGEPATQVRLRLPRADWRRRDDITIEGLAPCLPYFGVAEPMRAGRG